MGFCKFSHTVLRKVTTFAFSLCLLLFVSEARAQDFLWNQNPLLREGVYRYEAAEYESAVASLRTALAMDSLQLNAYLHLASAYLKMELPDSARIVIERGLRFFPDNLLLALLHAEAATALGQFDQGLEGYVRVDGALGKNKNLFPQVKRQLLHERIALLYHQKALTALQRESYDEMATYVQRALEYEPDRVELHRTLAYAHLAKQHWKDAVRAAEQGLRRVGPDTTLLRLQCKALYELKDYPALLVSAERLVRLRSDNVEFHLLHVEAFILNDRVLEALGILNGLLDRFPHERRVYDILINLHQRRQDFAAVIAVLKKQREYFPADPALLQRIAQTYELAELWAEARNAYRELGTLTGDSVTATLLIAQTFERQDSMSAAIRVYRNLLERLPDQPGALSALGRIYTRSGRWLEAVDAYTRLHAVQPELQTSGNLGWALEQAGRLQEARTAYAAAIQWGGADPLPYYRMSVMLKDSSREQSFMLAETALWRSLALAEEAQRQLAGAAREGKNLLDRRNTVDERQTREQYDDMNQLSETITYYLINNFPREEVERSLQNIVRSYEHSGLLHYLMGQFFEHWNEEQRAFDFYRIAARLSPRHHRIQIALGSQYERVGLMDSAIVAYERALVAAPSVRESYARLIRLYHHQKRLNDLCNRWLARYRVERDNTVLREALIEALHKAGRYAEAEKIIQTVQY